ncbi:hypothetical protein FRC02_008466 [Tulasnella sp. 418]|nr:hypothetical protein FRC02_008466 [Tulasnella sp. 418]
MSDAVTSKTSEDTSMATDTPDHPVQEQTKATPEKGKGKAKGGDAMDEDEEEDVEEDDDDSGEEEEDG